MKKGLNVFSMAPKETSDRHKKIQNGQNEEEVFILKFQLKTLSSF